MAKPAHVRGRAVAHHVHISASMNLIPTLSMVSVDELASVSGGQSPAVPPAHAPSALGTALADAATRRMAAVNDCAALLGKTGIGTSESHTARCEQMANELSWVDRRAY